MIDIKLDENGDLLLDGDGSDLATISDDDELAQTCQTILSIELGEFLLDQSIGLSHANLLSKEPNESFIQQDIEDCLTEQDSRVAGVSITDFVWDQVNRTVNIELTIEKKDGSSVTTKVEVNADAE